MQAFRIADRRFPIFDGTGARITGGRWNSQGRPVIYAAETFAGALLEVLVHSNLGRAPKTHAVVEITIPDRVPIEVVSSDTVAIKVQPRQERPAALRDNLDIGIV